MKQIINGIEMLEIPVYRTEDGRIFTNLQKALDYNLEFKIEKVLKEALISSGENIMISKNLTEEILRRKDVILDILFEYEEELGYE